MKNTILENFKEAQACLNAFVSDSANFEKITQAVNCLVASIQNEGKIYACGNGGSMCDAMHFAEELSGRFREDRPALPAIAISDPAHISCVANDYGYEQVFSRFIEAHGRKGDLLLAISTSGNSKNIIRAIQAAKAKQMLVIGLSGKTGGEMANLCDLEIRAPQSNYADRVQEIHIKIIHSLIHGVENRLGF